ncbi:MAG TPA: FkbM family methyltransferase [Candidatus Angelobacter sp.]|nr:FkbM family methyltransferase [Candidatus Angelobacter sp.]
MTRALSAILRPGDTFLDVGAHIGYHSVFASGIVGPEGRVFAFEPDPKVHARLANNLASFAHAQPLQCAVSDRQTEMVFERSWDEQESGWGALTSVRDFRKGEHILVQTVALDSWCEQEGVHAIRVAKIDAEGSEVAVLRGAQKVLQSYRPVLCIEFNEVLLKQAGESGKALVNVLSANHYCVHELSLRELRRLTEAPPEFADCLCVPDELRAEVLRLLRNRGFRY